MSHPLNTTIRRENPIPDTTFENVGNTVGAPTDTNVPTHVLTVVFCLQTKALEDMVDMLHCHSCRPDPTIVATFNFRRPPDNATEPKHQGKTAEHDENQQSAMC